MRKRIVLWVLFCLLFAWFGKDGQAQNPPVNATQLRGRTISTTAPTNGQVYVWNSSTGFWTPGSSGASPAGSLGTPQLNAGGGLFAAAANNFCDAATGRCGFNANSGLAELTLKPGPGRVLSICTTSANAEADLVGVGAGCAFLTQLSVGTLYELSGTVGTFCTITVITNDTHATGDADITGDSCGDGTAGQTITVYPASLTIQNSAGLTFITANRFGLALGTGDYNGPGLPTVPSQGNFIFGSTVGRQDDDSFFNLTFYPSATSVSNGAFILHMDTANDTAIGQVGNVLQIINDNRAGSVTRSTSLTFATGVEGATVTDLPIIDIESPNIFSGSVANFYGIRIGDIAGAGTGNFAIKTGLGLNQLGDQLYLAANVVNPFIQTKNTQSATAPGAAKCDVRVIAGTNAGTGKIVINCGTSATEVTIVDNIGAAF